MGWLSFRRSSRSVPAAAWPTAAEGDARTGRYLPGGTDWRLLPPIGTVVQPTHLTANDHFGDELGVQPGAPFLQQLGHDVAADAPRGLIGAQGVHLDDVNHQPNALPPLRAQRLTPAQRVVQRRPMWSGHRGSSAPGDADAGSQDQAQVPMFVPPPDANTPQSMPAERTTTVRAPLPLRTAANVADARPSQRLTTATPSSWAALRHIDAEAVSTRDAGPTFGTPIADEHGSDAARASTAAEPALRSAVQRASLGQSRRLGLGPPLSRPAARAAALPAQRVDAASVQPLESVGSAGVAAEAAVVTSPVEGVRPGPPQRQLAADSSERLAAGVVRNHDARVEAPATMAVPPISHTEPAMVPVPVAPLVQRSVSNEGARSNAEPETSTTETEPERIDETDQSVLGAGLEHRGSRPQAGPAQSSADGVDVSHMVGVRLIADARRKAAAESLPQLRLRSDPGISAQRSPARQSSLDAGAGSRIPEPDVSSRVPAAELGGAARSATRDHDTLIGTPPATTAIPNNTSALREMVPQGTMISPQHGASLNDVTSAVTGVFRARRSIESSRAAGAEGAVHGVAAPGAATLLRPTVQRAPLPAIAAAPDYLPPVRPAPSTAPARLVAQRFSDESWNVSARDTEPASSHGGSPPFQAAAVQRAVDSTAHGSAFETTAPPTDHQAGAAGGDVDGLAHEIYERVRSELRQELLLDRERAGLITDLR